VTELDIALAARIDDLILLATGRHRGAAGTVVEMTPAYPAEERSRPSRSTTSSSGPDPGQDEAPTLNEPANPRAGAGPVTLPDAEPDSIEPSLGPAGPGLQEPDEGPTGGE
jgi:hypothetical protein